MKKSEFYKRYKSIMDAHSKFEDECERMAELFQPYFSKEISVFFQPSDGFVIMHISGDSHFAGNIEVREALDNIQNDKYYYK